jgi:hypothetical protein
VCSVAVAIKAIKTFDFIATDEQKGMFSVAIKMNV